MLRWDARCGLQPTCLCLCPDQSCAPLLPQPTSQAVDDVNESRIFAGVHFRHAVEEGAKLGATVGQAVLSQFEGEWVGVLTGATQLEWMTRRVWWMWGAAQL